MKKLVVVVLALVYVYSISAQGTLGIRMGGSYNDTRVSGINPQFIPQTRYFEGFTAGVFYDIPLLNGFEFSPGINYTEKGFVVKERLEVDLLDMNLPFGIKLETKINYLEAPLLFRYNITKGISQFFFELGPTVGYAIYGEARTKATAIIDFNIVTLPINLNNPIYRRVELSAQVGMGTSIKAGNGKVYADIRYQRGFSDMLANTILDITMKNSSVNFGLGYVFNLTAPNPKNVPLRPKA